MNKLTIQGGGPQFWQDLQKWLTEYSGDKSVQFTAEDSTQSPDVNIFTLMAANEKFKKKQQLNNACVLNLKDK